RTWLAKGKLDQLADLWVKGLEIDWSALYTDSGKPRPRRISLPTYPFAREPFWLPGGKDVIAPSTPATAETALLCPVWEPVIRLSHAAPRFPAATDRIAIVGGDDTAVGIICHHYPQAQFVATYAGDDVDGIASALQASLDGAAIDHLFWIAPRRENTALATQNLLDAQDPSVIPLFRTIKALLQMGYGTTALRLSISSYHPLAGQHGDVAAPTHAGLHGLVGCLAKEYPVWQIRCADLDGTLDPARLADLCTLPADPTGDTLVCRGASWFRQCLASL